MYFQKIEINKWQQFYDVSIELDRKITIITGANGSGKTTLLNVLAMHHNWPFHSLATPKKTKRGVWKYLTNFFGTTKDELQIAIGSITYSNNQKARLMVPRESGPQYQIQIHGRQNIPCFFIPSHRSLFRYQQLTNIPTQKKNKRQAFEEVSNSIRQLYQGQHGQSSSFVMKNTLIGWAIKGYGVQKDNKYIMPKDEEQIKYYEGFQEVLKKILPTSLGFKEIEIRNMEIVFVCNDGNDEFILETASGGISALIDLAWQIYMFSPEKESTFTVLVDEIENHLHPTMQRRILPDLADAFPNVKFVVATHSPLIVSSARDAKTYVLQYNAQNKINSLLLDFYNHPRTANEILNDVLGVPTTFPLWVEKRLEEIIANNKNNLLTKEGFAKLRSDLEEIGLGKLFPEAVDKMLGGDK